MYISINHTYSTNARNVIISIENYDEVSVYKLEYVKQVKHILKHTINGNIINI